MVIMLDLPATQDLSNNPDFLSMIRLSAVRIIDMAIERLENIMK